MKKISAFTLIEAVLTMTILSIIAITAISIMKPVQYRSKSYMLLKKRIYSELDSATQSIRINCTKGGDLRKVYYDTENPASCNRNLPTDRPMNDAVKQKYAKYIGAEWDQSKCPVVTVDGVQFMTGLKLKNGACVTFEALETNDEGYSENNIGKILIDVNGDKEPNSLDPGGDRVILNFGAYGITTPIPEE